MKPGRVSIAQVIRAGYPFGESVNALEAAYVYDVNQRPERRIFDHRMWKITVMSGHCIASKRNIAVRAFLDGDAEWLVFIDDDQVFDPDAIHRLIAGAHPLERPIVSALIMAERTKGMPVAPACAAWDGQSFRQYEAIPTERWWQVGTAGCGFLAIHRTVLERVGDAHADDAWPWFKFAQWQPDGAKPDIMSEDYVFSLRAQALGYPVYVDTRAHVGHIKTRVLTARDFWNQFPPEAHEVTNVAVIPVKDNLPYTQGIVKQLLADDACHEVVVVDNGSTAKTRKWLDAQPITVLDAPGVGIHHMWNLGAAHALEYHARPHIAFLNNDIRISSPFMGPLSDALTHGPPDLMAVCPNYDGRTGAGIERLQGICAERYDGTGGLSGFAYMVRGELFLQGYRFPMDAMWWFGDNDLLLSIEMIGGWYGMAHSCTVEHLDGGGRTGKWDDPKVQQQLAKDQAAFQRKWAAMLAPQEAA